jgi:uracil-DNA glycosylase
MDRKINIDSLQQKSQNLHAPSSRKPINADEWYSMLVDQLKNTPHWANILIGSDQRRRYLKAALTQILEDMHNTDVLCPHYSEIFAFTRDAHPDHLIAVCMGQDPYPNFHAQGIAFSSKQLKRPKSLFNVFKAVAQSDQHTESFEDLTWDLRPWQRQGILLINTALTTKSGATKAHVDFWEPYMQLVISRIVLHVNKNVQRSIYWLFWGKDAQSKIPLITDNNTSGYHQVLTWGHPSFINKANNDPENKYAFINCDHFQRVSNIMNLQYNKQISWGVRALTPNCEVFINHKLDFLDPTNNKKSGRAGACLIFTKGYYYGEKITKYYELPEGMTSPDEKFALSMEADLVAKALEYFILAPTSVWNGLKIYTTTDVLIELKILISTISEELSKRIVCKKYTRDTYMNLKNHENPRYSYFYESFSKAKHIATDAARSMKEEVPWQHIELFTISKLISL